VGPRPLPPHPMKTTLKTSFSVVDLRGGQRGLPPPLGP